MRCLSAVLSVKDSKQSGRGCCMCRLLRQC